MGLSTTYTKTETDFLIQQSITTAYLGIATTTTTPPATGAYWYRVDAAGTYTNFKDSSNASIVVSEGDLVGNDITIEIKDNVSFKRINNKLSIDVAILTTVPNVNNKYISADFGVYSNFGGVQVFNEIVMLKSVNGVWQKRQIETFNGISPKYNEELVITENADLFMKYIKSIKLVKNFDLNTEYFIGNLKYKNSGYSGVLIYIRSLPSGAVEFIGEVPNVTLEEGNPLLIKNIHSNDLNRFIELELSKEAPQSGFNIDGTYFQDGYLSKKAFEHKVNNRIEIATPNRVITSLDLDKQFLAQEDGIYVNFDNIELWGERAILEYDKILNKWNKFIYDSGDFSNEENPQDFAVAKNLRKIIKNIKLVDGFDLTKKYFVSSLKYKEGGETGIYLCIKSLPLGAFEFETRINSIDLIKEKQILMNDEPRNRRVLITISKNAPDTFSQDVVYYQDSLLSGKAFFDASYNISHKPIITNRVVVPNNNDFAIRTLVHSLKPKANYYNRYVVVVPKGNYFEMDIRTCDFVDIEGESAEDCIITLDGMSAKIAPSDLSIGTGGVAINTIEHKYKHIFWHISNSEIRNLTLKVNDAKYAIHSDVPGNYEGGGRNLILIDNGNLIRLLGIGSWSNQKQVYKDCYFRNSINTQAIGWHNWGNQTAPAMGEFINCKSDYFFINITELGSGQADVVRLVNCTQTYTSEGGVGMFVEPQHGENPSDVPYCVKLVFEGKEMNVVQNNRPNYKIFK